MNFKIAASAFTILLAYGAYGGPTAFAGIDVNSTIDVTGTNNEAFIEQTSSKNSSASIIQKGDGNQAGHGGTAPGSLDTPGIYQKDSASTAVINQTGQKNSGSISQISTQGTADITQSSPLNGNTASVVQIVGYQASVLQNGDKNNAGIRQDQSSLAVAKIDQNGLEHNATIEQSGIGATSTTALVKQEGFHQYAKIKQLYSDPHVSVTQTGQNQVANIEQGGNFGQMDVNQSGGFIGANTANLTQTSFDAHAIVRQSGDFLVADIRQNNGANLRAIVDQTGQHHTAVITQDGGADTTATVTQSGSWNQASLTQLRSVASGKISQSDSRNTANMNQTHSEESRAEITQSGTWNLANLNQFDTQLSTASITQVGTGNSPATQNTAWISQTGVFQHASITQNGMNNHSGILQH